MLRNILSGIIQSLKSPNRKRLPMPVQIPNHPIACPKSNPLLPGYPVHPHWLVTCVHCKMQPRLLASRVLQRRMERSWQVLDKCEVGFE
jgi:hypothetical protein